MKNLTLENYELVEMNSAEITEVDGGFITCFGLVKWVGSEMASFGDEFAKVMNKCNC